MALTNGKFKGRNLSLLINGTEYNMDVSSVNFVSEDADVDITTFAELGANGAKDWFMDVTAVQDMATGALWRYIWDSAGTENVTYIYKQYGGTASATTPHFTGECTIPSKPNFGGEADSTFTFEVRFKLEAAPTIDTTP